MESPSPDGYRWEGRVFAYQGCRQCGAKVLQPLPSDDDLARMYRHGDYHEAYYEETAIGDWPQSLALARPGARLLDFGCGDGAFLAEASRRGFDAAGVELDAAAREVAQRNSGCPVLSLEDVVAGSQRFDVIHLGDVLEHLPAPADMLRRLEPLLEPDGVFFFEGPLEENASLVRFCNRAFTQFKRATGRPLLAELPPLHLSRTSAASQRQFFQRTMGYEVHAFEVGETGWPYLVTGNALAKDTKSRLRGIIGQAAVSLARLGNRVGATLGNRFAAITSPR
ncbi:MAG: class I SAM-dependent methyltransferase [Sphingomonas sp.]|nr:class I SAM-dependent methyltransferase [Sphingomonas sp.]